MRKPTQDRKIKTFIYKGLGIPVKLVNVHMKKVCGEWCIDINMNKLMLVVLRELVHKPTALTSDELRYIRSYLELTAKEFGSLFGISHAAVTKWENGQNRISPALELCIRLHVLNHLQAKDKEFRTLYKTLNLQQLSKNPKTKILSIAIDATTDEPVSIH